MMVTLLTSVFKFLMMFLLNLVVSISMTIEGEIGLVLHAGTRIKVIITCCAFAGIYILWTVPDAARIALSLVLFLEFAFSLIMTIDFQRYTSRKQASSKALCKGNNHFADMPSEAAGKKNDTLMDSLINGQDEPDLERIKELATEYSDYKNKIRVSGDEKESE